MVVRRLLSSPASARKKLPVHKPTVLALAIRGDARWHHSTTSGLRASAFSMFRAPTMMAISGTARISSCFCAVRVTSVSEALLNPLRPLAPAAVTAAMDY
jgi:hypothetical protein